MKFRGMIFNYGNPRGPHENCPHISRKGKPCNKPAGHGRHITSRGIRDVCGFDYSWVRLAYLCECGFSSSRRSDFEKWHNKAGRLWMVHGLHQTELQEYVQEPSEAPEIPRAPQIHVF